MAASKSPMPHSYEFAMSDIQKLKSKVTEIRKMCGLCEIDFVNQDKAMTLSSNNQVLLDIVKETIDREYLKTSSGTYFFARHMDIKDTTAPLSWKFSEQTSRLMNHFYSDQLNELTNNTNCSRKTEKQGKLGDCLIIRSPIQYAVDIDSKLVGMSKECKEIEQNKAVIKTSGANAKEFCKTQTTKTSFCWFEHKANKLNICCCTKDNVDELVTEWENYGNKPKIERAGQKEQTTEPEAKVSSQVQQQQNQQKKDEQASLPTSSKDFQKNDLTMSAKWDNDGDVNQLQHELTTNTSEKNDDENHIPSTKPKMDLPDNPSDSTERNPVHDHDFNQNEQRDIVSDATNNHGKYEFPVGQLHVLIYKQSVTEIKDMDAIVNAANDQLMHAGGIAGYISKAAGKSMDDECRNYITKRGKMNDSDVFVSGSGKMSCRGIFHAVGPRWSDYSRKESKCARVLHDTVYNCLQEMESRKWQRIALCAISSGIFGVPKKLCTAMYIKAMENFAMDNPKSKIEVHFIDVNPDIIELVIEAHKERVKNGRSPDFDEAVSLHNRHNKHSKNMGGKYWQVQERPMYSDPWKDKGWIKVTSENTSRITTKQGITVTENKVKTSEKKTTNRDVKKDSPSNVMCCYHPLLESKKVLECGHGYCTGCAPHTKNGCKQCKKAWANKSGHHSEPDNWMHDKGSTQECPICLEVVPDPVTLECKHMFCKICMQQIEKNPKCPVCGNVFGIVTGTQPDGHMFYKVDKHTKLPGYERNGAIQIAYIFLDGKQQDCHPNPGKPYRGMRRDAFLPDTMEGNTILELLKIAFLRKLIFTIGESRTTGKQGVITWNDIHHKTNTNGGPYGYPDPDYLGRVRDELAAKGVTE